MPLETTPFPNGSARFYAVVRHYTEVSELLQAGARAIKAVDDLERGIMDVFARGKLSDEDFDILCALLPAHLRHSSKEHRELQKLMRRQRPSRKRR